MKKIATVFFILFSLISCMETKDSDENIYDAVVAGGGLAGLSAAYHLKNTLGENAKIVLLEKENRLGGRVFTRKFGEYDYELGAMFAYSPTLAPKDFQLPELVVEPNSYGVYENGKLTFSTAIDKYDSFLTSVSNVLGNGKRYGKYGYLSHRTGGNGTMIEAYEKELEGKFILDAEVVSVKNENGSNVVRYKRGRKEEKIKAKTVIVATTATVASKIIKEMGTESENFLKSISYKSRAVVVFLVKLDKPLNFASISGENLKVYVANNGNNVASIYCYLYKQERNSVDFAMKRLKDMKVLDEKSEILHTDSVLWKEEGPLVAESYKNFKESILNPLPGVFLAGDYTWWNRYKVPYGMPPAYFSGKNAAKKASEYLKKQSK